MYNIICQNAHACYICIPFFVNGPIAQLGERFNGIEEVSGSIPLGSTLNGITGS